MKKVMLLAVALVALAASIPSTATAWTHCGTPQAEADCPPITTCINGVETQVPDNGQYQPGECPPPPPVTKTVCLNGETVTLPEDQIPEGTPEGECAVTPPPVSTPLPPEDVVPPVTDTPPTDTEETPEDTPTHDIGTPVDVKGKEQEKGGGQVTGVLPAEQADTGATLPYTGLPLGVVAIGGAMLLAAGLGLRKLSHN